MERLSTALELRADGRTLRGTVIRYGDFSPSHRERIVGGARLAPNVVLNLRHNRLQSVAHSPDGGLTLTTTPDGVELRAEVPRTPAGDVALAGVSNGHYRGLSVEMVVHRDTRTTSGVRVIDDFTIHGIGLVPEPSFPASGVEARARKKRRMFGWL